MESGIMDFLGFDQTASQMRSPLHGIVLGDVCVFVWLVQPLGYLAWWRGSNRLLKRVTSQTLHPNTLGPRRIFLEKGLCVLQSRSGRVCELEIRLDSTEGLYLGSLEKNATILCHAFSSLLGAIS